MQEKPESRVAPTTTYSIKDINGYLLGYVKNKKLKSDFWIEGTDGTILGEARYFSRRKLWFDRYEIYDAQNQLLAIIRSLKSEWLINDPRDQQLAVGRRSSRWFERDTYQILDNEGSIIAKIYRKRDLLVRNSYNIEIERQSLDHIIIISYAHIMMPSIT